MIAALFVDTGGTYFGLPGVDPWDKERDARKYPGPCPVIAHPPCERWGSFWYGGPMLHKLGRRKIKGDDDGCFAAALAAVRKWGGVLEHPRNSGAWAHFGIRKPPYTGGWITAGDKIGLTCCVFQANYGHQSLKPTWLYYVGGSTTDIHKTPPPELKWGRPEGEFVPISGRSFHSVEERERCIAAGWKYKPRIPTRLRSVTPTPFRDLLIEMARMAW